MIRRVKLVNCFQHAQEERDFKPGITLITGRNGSGKSNRMRAVEYGITGRLPTQSKEDMLRWGAEGGFVEVELDTPNGTALITRDIVKAKQSFKQGGVSLTKKSDVDAAASAVLGLDPQAASSLVFASQTEMDALLRMQHADRLRILSMLFGLDRARQLQAVAHERLMTITVYPDTSQEEARIASETEAYRRALSEAGKAKADADTVFTRLAAGRNDLVRRKNLPVEEDVAAARASAEKELVSRQRELAELSAKLSEWKNKLSEIPEVDALKVAELTTARDGWHKLKTLDTELSGIMEVRGRIKTPVPPAEPRVLEDSLVRARVDYDSHMRRMSLFEKGKCPVCETSFTLAPPELERVRAESAEYQRSYAVFQAKAQRLQGAWDVYEQALRNYESDTRSCGADEARVRGEISLLEKYRSADLSDFERLTSEARKRREWLSSIEDLERHAAKVREEETRCKLKLGALPSETVKRDDLPGIDKALAAIEEAAGRSQALLERVAGCKASLEELDKQNARLAEQRERRGKSLWGRRLLEDMKDALRSDGLPVIVLRKMVTRLNRSVAVKLSELGADFTMRLNENMDFSVSFGGGAERPCSVLSGGQSVMASVAVRLALMDTLSKGSAGILFLDEPTAFLDEPNRAAAVDVLERAASVFSGANMTVFLITNDEALKQMRMADEWPVLGNS